VNDRLFESFFLMRRERICYHSFVITAVIQSYSYHNNEVCGAFASIVFGKMRDFRVSVSRDQTTFHLG